MDVINVPVQSLPQEEPQVYWPATPSQGSKHKHSLPTKLPRPAAARALSLFSSAQPDNVQQQLPPSQEARPQHLLTH